MVRTTESELRRAFSRLLPPDVVIVVRVEDTLIPSLHPDEAASISRMHSKRLAEFATARDCARRALRRLGEGPSAIPRANTGEPVWPTTVVGSITHCIGVRAAAVARKAVVRSIGIDAALNSPIADRILSSVATEGELRMLSKLGATYPPTAWSAVLWSAKESVFKAWFALVRIRLDLSEFAVRLAPDGYSFTSLVVPRSAEVVPWRTGIPRRFDGRWTVCSDHILTTVVCRYDRHP
jgi:4'-phosphopantetheinyl transferase EntD